jgi:hypothetical protein
MIYLQQGTVVAAEGNEIYQNFQKEGTDLPYTHCSFQGCQNLGPTVAALFSGNCCYISRVAGQQLNCNGVKGDAELEVKLHRRDSNGMVCKDQRCIQTD